MLVCLFSSLATADSIELNVLPSARAPFTAAQDWARSLANLRSVRVRAGGGQDRAKPDIQKSGSTILVTGVIDSSNKLVVPGRSFGIRQTAALQNWLDEQRTSFGKPKAAPADDRFGLTTANLERAHEALKSVVTKTTKDQPVRKVVAYAARRTGLRLVVSSEAKRIVGKQKVPEEWEGFTAGTVMAVALRPLELVFVPKASGNGEITLYVTTDDTVQEPWPVGWKSELTNRKLIPKIYDPFPINIDGAPIADVMTAIEGRLEVPVHYDTATLALKQVDPAKMPVTYSSQRTMYNKAIKIMLQKAKLKHDIRVDERGKAFLWIMPRGI